jgi:acetyltransferase-like isoleucine patch superfamily enzyme
MSSIKEAAARLQTAVWPESRAALRMPVAMNPPQPRQFAAFGANSQIIPPARVIGASNVAIGNGVVVMENAEIVANAAGTRPTLTLGDGVQLGRFATVWATVGIRLGQGVLSSDYVSLLDCWGPPELTHGGIPVPPGAPIVVETSAYLGAGCVIGPGVTVGEGAFVGEGAVVIDDVPAHSVVYGNPARVTRQWTQADGWQGDHFGRAS